MSLSTMLIVYSIDFGYFFVVAANLTAASRNAVQSSILGFQAPGQGTLPAAGPPNVAGTVANLALAGLGALSNSTTVSAIKVCSKAIGTSGNFVECSSYGAPTGGTYAVTSSVAAAADPEAPVFYLNRVDVTYTVTPPIPISVLGASLVPNLNFHRFVVMRAED